MPFISNAYAQAADTAQASPGLMGSLTSMLPLLLMFVVLYFLMIRPQMRRQKELRSMVEALAVGDEVATNGGLLGRVTELSESVVTLDVGSGTLVRIQRGAVSQVLPKGTLK